MKKIICLIAIIMSVVMLMGCNNPEAKHGKGEAYGITANACPVHVSVTVDGDDKISEVKIEEYLSIYDIGKLDQKCGKWYKYGVEINEAENGYAKNVRIGKKIFVYDVDGYKCEEIPGSDKSVETFLESGGGKWYIKQMKKGNFDITNNYGADYNVSFTEYDDYKLDKTIWADKMKNGFHEGVEYENGWKEDIYSLITHLKNHGFYDYTGEEKPTGKKKTFKVGKFDTLVTLENFHDYMKLSKKAYEKARNDIK